MFIGLSPWLLRASTSWRVDRPASSEDRATRRAAGEGHRSRAVDPMADLAARAGAYNEPESEHDGRHRLRCHRCACRERGEVVRRSGCARQPAGTKNVLQHFLFHRARRDDRTWAQPCKLANRWRRKATLAPRISSARRRDGRRRVARSAGIDLYRRCPRGDLLAVRAIARVGLSLGPDFDLSDVAASLQSAAERGDAESCFYLAHMHRRGQGVERDASRASEWMRRAVELGFDPARTAKRQAAFAAPRRKFHTAPAYTTDYPITD